ncbi:uncharacterized protein LOC133380979 isoform X2 [Rhineura floridana]|uniref:uncharacterized protein LOC133380979 isoform X2 n=1 Tax=Rhineura floridana TaxID=261503 RepID=UPI002AC879CD|nr:uncharacterized protein LOC133380979 isoform X2 [Rhineura floridana]
MVEEFPSSASPMKFFLFLILVAAALAVVKTGTHKEMKTLTAGSQVKIPCKLKGPLLNWYWVPQYPICAGIGNEGHVAVFSVTGGEDRVLPMRFQQRSAKQGNKANGSLVLILKTLNMNDSGIFYCSDGKKNSTMISVTVEPGDGGGIVRTSKMTLQNHQTVTLSCKLCEDQDQAKSTTIWMLNGKEVSENADIRWTRNSLTIKKFSRQYYGLWNCSHPACQYGYCLEASSGKSGNEEILHSNPNLQGPTADPRIIGGCVAGLLTLLLVGAIVFITCRNRSSHSISETAKQTEAQGSNDPAVPEGSSQSREKEEPGTDDHAYIEGAEGIQYSAVEFRESGRYQTKMDNGTSTVIYAEMPKSS